VSFESVRVERFDVVGFLHHHSRVGLFFAVARGLLDVKSFQGGELLVAWRE